MTATTARLDAIDARLEAAAPGAITITPSDIAYLLTLARKQAAALEAVRELAERWAGLDNSSVARSNRLRTLRAALGDGE